MPFSLQLACASIITVVVFCTASHIRGFACGSFLTVIVERTDCFGRYPGEMEYVWVPCSFVQPLHRESATVEMAGGGVVTM